MAFLFKEESDSSRTHDDSSIDTLLSDLSDDDESNQSGKVPKRQSLSKRKRFEKEFALRDEVLERLGKDRSDAYIALLRHHEEMVRAEAFIVLEQEGRAALKGASKNKNYKKDDDSIGPRVVKAIEHCPDKKCGFFLKEVILFETGLAFPALLCFVLYSSAHTASYETMYNLLGVISKELRVSQESVFIGSMILSYVLFRANGGLWEWSSKSKYDIAKFELHNRFQLGCWDAKLHQWFRKRYTVKSILSFLAFYMCFLAVEELKISLLRPLFSDRTWIFDNLPSKPYDVESVITLWLNGVWTEECDEDDLSASEMEECLILEKLTKDDERTVEMQLSSVSYEKVFGEETAIAVSFFTSVAINTCLGLLSFYILYYRLGSRVYD
mmetsp:Transcript_12497/g.19257  ORF Transcript_12497/g.19257 Transcript_12497/m.19257 type:complete len:383 (-) Transcript_12497:4-1152(-)